jgi:AmmeMemoRadiSam system protein B/AmmeMemoRadiSam system protein A
MNRHTKPSHDGHHGDVPHKPGIPDSPGAHPGSAGVRLPSVAGLFYPADAESLGRMVDGLIAKAPAHALKNLRALVSPHAGYEYSSPVAAHGFKLLAGRSVDTVILLAASHYAYFDGALVSQASAYRTPLGDVPVSEKARALAGRGPFVSDASCHVQRPSWSRHSPRPAPHEDDDTPETWEHSIEVQLPFLQRVLGRFEIVPVTFGEADPEDAARVLADLVDDRTLVVASTDLSHFHSHDEAARLDARCVRAICAMDFEDMPAQEACGRTPVLVLMHLARIKGWKPRLLDSRNSGDVTGDRTRVVGYASIAFTSDEAASDPPASPPVETHAGVLSEDEQQYLLGLARHTLQSVTAGGDLPELEPGEVPERLHQPRACFVTLTGNGRLRGCIGNLHPGGRPLFRAVMENARSAALNDPRFPELEHSEVDQVHIEISVLGEPHRLEFDSPARLLERLRPGHDGVILHIGHRQATFLPQVWEQLPDAEEFLRHLSQKAGCDPDAWQDPETRVSVYHVQAFEEPE